MDFHLIRISKEATLADELQLVLRGSGYKVFFDRTNLPPGEEFHTRTHIRRVIDKAKGCAFRCLAGLLVQGDDLMSMPLNMHAARTALNRDAELRQWAEQWLKDKERAGHTALTDEEFEKHWLYVRPERMHEGAIEAVAAYLQQQR